MSKLYPSFKSLLIPAIALLQACSGPVHRSSQPSPPVAPEVAATTGDGPPIVDHLDESLVPNAVPKSEPISRYGNPPIYEVFGKQYKTLASSEGYKAEGTASWYGRKFHGHRTSSGEPYDMFAMTAAHRSLPLPTYVKVKNIHNGKEVILKVNDRGPFVHNRLIDVSYAAAKKLGIHESGTGKVVVTAIDPSVWHQQQKNAVAKAEKAAKPNAKPSTIAKKSQIQEQTQLYIQLGAFTKKLNAQKLAESASHLTHALKNVNVQVYENQLDDKDVYKVRIGPLKNKTEAEKLQKELVALSHDFTATLVYEKMLPF